MVWRMLHAVIPAGGSGTRLRPLLQATVARLAAVSPLTDTLVVTGAVHAGAVALQLPGLPPENIRVEPSPRDSCAAIGLAAALIARKDPRAVIGSFAADHLIPDVERLTVVLEQAEAAAEEGLLITVGITPTGSETGYGYLRCGEGVARAGLVATVPGDFGWTDIGDFHALGQVLEPDEHGNVQFGDGKGDVLLDEVAHSVVVPRSGRLVAALGLEDVIIADTPDAVLVCRRDRAQDMKRLVDELKGRGDQRV